MSYRTMYYIACDDCGAPAGSQDDVVFSKKEAAEVAKSLGWSVGKYTQLCPDCTKKAKEISV